MKQHAMAYDTETTGLEPYRGHRMFSFSTCDPEGQTSVVRKDRDPEGFQMYGQAVWDREDVYKVMHNAKFDVTMSIVSGFKVPWKARIHDTMIMSKLLRSDARHGLKELCYELAGFPTDDEKAVKRAIGESKDYSRCPDYIMDLYQRRDAERTMLLYEFFWPKIQADERLLRLYNLEIDLIWTTIRIEQRGMMVSPREIEKLSKELAAEAARIGKTFPPGVDPDHQSAFQKWLFKDLGLPVLKRSEKTGDPSTKKEILLELFKQYPERVELQNSLKWRSYTRGVTTIRKYTTFMDDRCVIHPTVNTCAAKTGRESCERPNLQNVSKENNPNNPFPIPARRCFRVRPGHAAVLLDYSGIEARLLINASQDKEFIRIMNEGGDPHSEAANELLSSLWHRAITSQNNDEIGAFRYVAKQVNFAIPYGAGLSKVILMLQKFLERKEITQNFEHYKKRFSGYCGLNQRFANMARREGIIRTHFGRPIMVEPGKWYAAVNYHIQGTAADLLKMAQVRVDNLLKEITGDEWRLLLPIHDELIIEFPRRWFPRMKEILKQVRAVMIDFPEFRIPMEIEAKFTVTTWAAAKKYNFME